MQFGPVIKYANFGNLKHAKFGNRSGLNVCDPPTIWTLSVLTGKTLDLTKAAGQVVELGGWQLSMSRRAKSRLSSLTNKDQLIHQLHGQVDTLAQVVSVRDSKVVALEEKYMVSGGLCLVFRVHSELELHMRYDTVIYNYRF